MATSYARRARFDDLMIDLVLGLDTRSQLQRMASTEARDHHIECLGTMIAEAHIEIQRGADVAAWKRPLSEDSRVRVPG